MKRCRRASMGDIIADIQKVKLMLEESCARNIHKPTEDVFLTVSGSMESVHDMLSLRAEHTIQNVPEFPNFEPSSEVNTAQQKSEANFRAHPCDSTFINDIFSSVQSLASTRSSVSRTGSMRLSTHTAPEATVLFIDIKGFTARCAALPAGRVGEWVAAFYERVDSVAAAHGVSKAEVRGDCCICVAGVEGAVPSRAAAAAAWEDRRGDQATRMLAFAAALQADLASLPAGGDGGAATATRMGVATGEVAFLVGDGGGDGAAGFSSVQGDAVNLAARMEALGAAGAVWVHKSTADRWAAEGGRAAPATEWVEVKGRGLQRAAVFDCAARAFRAGAGAGAAMGTAGTARAASLLGPAAQLRRSASGPV